MTRALSDQTRWPTAHSSPPTAAVDTRSKGSAFDKKTKSVRTLRDTANGTVSRALSTTSLTPEFSTPPLSPTAAAFVTNEDGDDAGDIELFTQLDEFVAGDEDYDSDLFAGIDDADDLIE